MIAIVSALLAVLPGYTLAAILSRRGERTAAGRRLCTAIVWSLLIDSIPAWVPRGQTIPLEFWLYAVFALSIAGGVLLAMDVSKDARHIRERLAGADVFFWLSAGTLGVFALILMVRPNIDWDAITYYLPVAVDTVLNGHTSSFLSAHVTTAQHAANVQPPIMPMLYALAIATAALAHAQADTAIRMFALVFTAGTWLSTRRIARIFLPESLSELAGLLYLLLPATISTICDNPLYLDLGFSFICVTLIADILEHDAADRLALLRIAAVASAAVMFKVDGLPFVVLVMAAVIVAHLPKAAARIAAGMVAAAMIALSAKLHFFDNVGSPTLWISIAVVAALLIYCARPHRLAFRVHPIAVALALVGLFPAVFDVVHLTAIIGNPAGFYVPQLAKVAIPHWHDAVALINSADIYGSGSLPGLPEHFGPGLLLWWGFSPLLAFSALAGVAIAGKRNSKILQIALIVVLFALAFLTIFRLDDFRHLLPITALLPVLATFAVSAVERKSIRQAWIIALLLGDIVFAWTAQQSFFVVPLGILDALHLDQWHALSTPALATILALCVAFAAFSAWFVRILSDNERGTTVFCAACVALIFSPVAMTAIHPGYHAQAAEVLADEDGGYPRVLFPALDTWHSKLLLAYKSYGITWFSLGQTRRIDISDASDLARVQPLLRVGNARSVVHSLGIDGAILPLENGGEYPAYGKLIGLGRLNGVLAVSDPLLSAQTSSDVWTYSRFYAMTEPVTLQASLYIRGPRSALRISDAPVRSSSGLTTLQVRSQHSALFTKAIVETTQNGINGVVNKQLTLTPHDGSLRLSAIVSALWPQDGPVLVRAVEFSNARGTTVASFRSLGFEIESAGKTFRTTLPQPFVLHAEDALTQSSLPDGPTIILQIGDGPLCRAGSSVNVSASGVDGLGRARKAWAVHKSARAGSTVTMDLGTRKAATLQIIGSGRCAVSETYERREAPAGDSLLLSAVILSRSASQTVRTEAAFSSTKR